MTTTLNKSENEFIDIAPESHWASYNCLLWLIVAPAHIFTFNYLYFLKYYSGLGVNAVSWLLSMLHLLSLSKSLGMTLFVSDWNLRQMLSVLVIMELGSSTQEILLWLMKFEMDRVKLGYDLGWGLMIGFLFLNQS